MTSRTPIERAVAAYASDWRKSAANSEGFARVNPETLANSTAPNFTFRYIDISSVTMGAIDFRSIETIRFGDSPSRARRVVRPGDTLISTVRPLLRSHTFADWLNDEPTVCSTGFAVIRCEENIRPNFLKHLPFSEQIIRQLVAWQCGTNYPAVNERDIKKLMLPVPSSKEQAIIAGILDAVDTAIGRTRETISRAQEVKRALVQKLFSEGTQKQKQRKTELGFIPKSWDVLPVREVVTNFQYGLSVPMQLTGTLPILRMGNIQKGEATLKGLKFVTLPDNVIGPYLLRRGDVLFNRTNSQELVGKVGIYRNDQPAVFASYLIRILPNTERIDNYYLGQVLNSYSAQCRIKRYATPGVQQVNINATNLAKVLIPIPVGEQGLKEQEEIATVLEQADELLRNSGSVLEAQQILKRSIMHDLLTGNVRVNNLTSTTF